MMTDESTFLLPVVIDDTRDAEAKVPAKFRAVQWTRLALSEAQGAQAEATQLATRARDVSIIAGIRRANDETLALRDETLHRDAKFQQGMKEAEARAAVQPQPKT